MMTAGDPFERLVDLLWRLLRDPGTRDMLALILVLLPVLIALFAYLMVGRP